MSYKGYKDKEKRKTWLRNYCREYMKDWRKKNPKKVKEIDARAKRKLRMRVLEYLGGAKCKRCGCTDVRILEINHINFGGNKEQKEKGYWNFLRNILRDKRKDEFEVLCRVCNAVHYCEEKFGLKYEVKCITSAC